MRNLICILLLLPCALKAQLDRIKLDMTEAEFQKAVPEALRDFDAESGWVKDSASAAGIQGGVQWRFYRDTVVAYHFTSVTATGPSEQYPGVDSSKVHRMKMSADAIRRGIETAHGTPAKLYNLPLTAPNPMNNPLVYLAEWIDEKDRMIRITIAAKSIGGNRINGPAFGSAPKLESYEMYIAVTMRSTHTYLRYSIGQSAATFFQSNSNLLDQAKFRDNHIYTISDSTVSNNAHWNFIFVKDQLAMMEYGAYISTQSDIITGNEAYSTARRQTEKILAQGKKACGKNDTVSNRMPEKYQEHSLAVAYSEIWLYCDWIPKEGYAVLQLMEIGGGKNPATVFAISFYYERRK